jgi:DNA-binding transcriptional MerR regulator
MKQPYRTAQIARLIGVHPNTIRFYEELRLLPKIPRTESGYRIFDDRHLAQLRFLRVAFRAEIISDRLRQEVYAIVKTAAMGDLDGAYRDTANYLAHLRAEKSRAEEAISIAWNITMDSESPDEEIIFHGRVKAAESLGVTIDVLRDWERNGLLEVPRDANKYRKYGLTEMKRLKVIRILRSAHYSMMSIRRMLARLDREDADIREALNTPDEEEDVITAADHYVTALDSAEKDALEMMKMLDAMQKTKT